MYKLIRANTVTNELDPYYDQLLMDYAQVTNRISYDDILKLGEAAEAGLHKQTLRDIYTYVGELNDIANEFGTDIDEAIEVDDEAADIADKLDSLIFWQH